MEIRVIRGKKPFGSGLSRLGNHSLFDKFWVSLIIVVSYATLWSKLIIHQSKEVGNMNQTETVQVLAVCIDLARHSLLERGD